MAEMSIWSEPGFPEPPPHTTAPRSYALPSRGARPPHIATLRTKAAGAAPWSSARRKLSGPS
eukprot:6443136-Alexandrium_andersonii.AAC.1